MIEAAGAGNDTVHALVSFSLVDTDGAGASGAQVENLVLEGDSAINATGNGGPNALTGNGTANVLDGGAGADTLRGGAGNDSYVVDEAGDRIAEMAGGGIDTILSAISYRLADSDGDGPDGANVENLVLTGTRANNGVGNALANLLRGNQAANGLDGGAGDDTLAGAGGNDIYVVDSAGDRVDEATEPGGTLDAGGLDLVRSSVAFTLGNFVERLLLSGTQAINGTGNALANALTGNTAANTLRGNGGNDTLTGGLGNDSLVGGAGNDSLVGGGGRDTLDGGAGIDNLLFNIAPVAGAGPDLVLAFDLGGQTDRILLDDDAFTALGTVTGPSALDPSMLRIGAAALTPDQHIVYNRATGALYYDADGSGSLAQVQFARLGTSTHPVLDAGDFLVVG